MRRFPGWDENAEDKKQLPGLSCPAR